jgi:hypothetical protein
MGDAEKSCILVYNHTLDFGASSIDRRFRRGLSTRPLNGCTNQSNDWFFNSMGFDSREKPMRTLQYRFEDLAGIVFGACYLPQ